MLTGQSRRRLGTGACLTAVGLIMAMGATAQARVTKIIIDSKVSPAFDGARFGNSGQYETLAGRAYGELDPNDRRNAVIQDIALAPRNARGMVEYMATFQLVKPVDMTKASRLLWHDVPNRARRTAIFPVERADGDIGLTSGWQGDNAGRTVPGPDNEYVIVPVAKNPDGSAVTGRVMARIFNAEGKDSQRLMVYANPMPYHPAILDTTQASLVTPDVETGCHRMSGSVNDAGAAL